MGRSLVGLAKPPPVGLRLGTLAGLSSRGLMVHTQNPVAVNPVLEQPRLDWQSIRQPITIEGWRRWVRTFMKAAMAFQGGTFEAPVILQQFKDRDKMAGGMARGYTYQYTQASTGPGSQRTVALGGRPRAGGPNVGR